MSTLQDRPNTALLVVDVQNGVVAAAHRRDEVVANVAHLVERARHDRIPVVWVQHADEGLVRGSDDWHIVPELSPDDTEPRVHKGYGDAFEDTPLESVLADVRALATAGVRIWADYAKARAGLGLAVRCRAARDGGALVPERSACRVVRTCTWQTSRAVCQGRLQSESLGTGSCKRSVLQ